MNISFTDMSLVQMSISAAVMILAIIVVRALAINKLPKKVFVLLWEVVLLRLLIPFSIPSMFSAYTFVRRNEPLQEALTEVTALAVITQVAEMQTNTGGNMGAAMTGQNNVPELSPWVILWIVGLLLCAAYFAVSYLRCHFEFQTSLPVRNEFTMKWLREHRLKRSIQIRRSDRISAPLTYGIVKPVILMPKKTDWENRQQLEYVLLHEYTHICRFDMVVKLVATFALCIHWFNPFVWAMYILFNRDIELSCDESVVRQFGETSKSVYARTLITMEEKKSGLTPLYNSFSRNAIEERITAIMKTKKITIGILVLSALVMIAIVVLFATSAKEQNGQMLFVMGKVYNSTREDVSDTVEQEMEMSEFDSPHIGVIEGTVDKGQIPEEELQSNFGYVGSEVVFNGSGVAVNMDGKWIQFEADEKGITSSTGVEDENEQNVKETAPEGIIGESVEITGSALEMAKEVVAQKYADLQDDRYVNWKIDSLTEEHYYDFGGADAGVRVTVYQLNYALLAEDPDKVTLTGGMTMDEEGWVVPEYPGSTYLCLVADGGALSYVVLTENDCFPGDEVFTDDLKQLLNLENTDESYLEIVEANEKKITEQIADIIGEAESVRYTLENYELEIHQAEGNRVDCTFWADWKSVREAEDDPLIQGLYQAVEALSDKEEKDYATEIADGWLAEVQSWLVDERLDTQIVVLVTEADSWGLYFKYVMDGQEELIPLQNMQRRIGQRMKRSVVSRELIS